MGKARFGGDSPASRLENMCYKPWRIHPDNYNTFQSLRKQRSSFATCQPRPRHSVAVMAWGNLPWGHARNTWGPSLHRLMDEREMALHKLLPHRALANKTDLTVHLSPIVSVRPRSHPIRRGPDDGVAGGDAGPGMRLHRQQPHGVPH